jgi:CBS domain containing-hemolysin-like protein
VTAWVTVAALVLANAFYVAAEFGAVGVRRSRVRRLAGDGHRRAKSLLPYVEDPAGLVRYISASQIGITLANLTLGAYAELKFGPTVEELLRSFAGVDAAAAKSAAELVVLICLTAVLVVFGELIPKSLALQHPTETALFTVMPMRWSLAVFRPLAAILNVTGLFVLRLLGSSSGTHRHIHSPEEIELLIAESRDGGLLEPEEHRRLHRALRLGLRTARDLMVPYERLRTLHVETPWEQVVRFVVNTPYSRIPVYKDAPDRIVGTLRVRDLVARYATEGPTPLARLTRPVVGVREDLSADRIIGLMRERRVHQAIVVDPDGRAIGLVTIQDVLSELLGSTRTR